jgi:hypothetical protein
VRVDKQLSGRPFERAGKNIYRALYLESTDPLRYHPRFTLLRSWQTAE